MQSFQSWSPSGSEGYFSNLLNIYLPGRRKNLWDQEQKNPRHPTKFHQEAKWVLEDPEGLQEP